MRASLLLIFLALSGCASQSSSTKITAAPVAPLSEYTLHDYAGNIMLQLLNNTTVPLHSGTVVVGNFTPIEDGSVSVSTAAAPNIGLQLQQSMQTLLSNSGFKVVAFDGIGHLVVDKNNRINISAGDHYPANIKVDYVLTGTLTPQQHAYVVNVKLVDVLANHIVAGSTTEIPLNVFWSRDQVKLKDGYLYRAKP